MLDDHHWQRREEGEDAVLESASADLHRICPTIRRSFNRLKEISKRASDQDERPGVVPTDRRVVEVATGSESAFVVEEVRVALKPSGRVLEVTAEHNNLGNTVRDNCPVTSERAVDHAEMDELGSVPKGNSVNGTAQFALREIKVIRIDNREIGQNERVVPTAVRLDTRELAVTDGESFAIGWSIQDGQGYVLKQIALDGHVRGGPDLGQILTRSTAVHERGAREIDRTCAFE
jgi:hypothetical protein